MYTTQTVITRNLRSSINFDILIPLILKVKGDLLQQSEKSLQLEIQMLSQMSGMNTREILKLENQIGADQRRKLRKLR